MAQIPKDECARIVGGCADLRHIVNKATLKDCVRERHQSGVLIQEGKDVRTVNAIFGLHEFDLMLSAEELCDTLQQV